MGDGFGSDTILGGETDETTGDVLDASGLTTDALLDLSAGSAANPEDGTLTTAGGTATFADIEAVFLGSGNHSLIGSGGADQVYTGTGADRFDGGAGNNRVDLAADNASDTVVLDDGDGQDTVVNFAGPIDNGNGTWTGRDMFDVSALTDAQGNPASVWNAVVGNDCNGNAVVTFPNGEAITLIGITPARLSDPPALIAMGIPGSDGTVTGTAGDDLIDSGYIGDSDGDRIDAGDNLGAGDAQDDIVVAGAGNDSVLAGAGNDTVFGGTGNDRINGGNGADGLSGGDGNDTLWGQAGNDTLAGGAAADILFGGADADVLTCGAGKDVLDGVAGNDVMSGDDGDDRFVLADDFGTDMVTGGEGAETARDVLDATAMTQDVVLELSTDAQGDAEVGVLTSAGGTATFNQIEFYQLGGGDDSLIGSSGDDRVAIGAGNDRADGGAGNDTIWGDGGNDTLTGGTGADTLYGGSGDDVIRFAQGDTASGGDDNDLFDLQDLAEPGSDTISVIGGAGYDTLRLGQLAQWNTLQLTSTGPGGVSGSILLDDGTILNFTEIENIICFTPGTGIAPPHGTRAVETLKVGDLVVTRDHGLRPIRWLGQRTVPAQGRFAPIRIQPGVVMGQEGSLLVSPQHRMLFQGYRAELLFGEREVLFAATHLIDGRLVTREEGRLVTYIHMMFDEHEIIHAQGAATESFHPGHVGLSAITGPCARGAVRPVPRIAGDAAGIRPHRAPLSAST